MKKLLLLSTLFSLFCGIIFGQHLIRVNNDPAANADYTTIQSAIDGAQPGDTIYVEGSPVNYAGTKIDKKLVIIGPGYFLADNDSTQANIHVAEISASLDFIKGSEGSKVCGLIIDQTIYIRDDEIVVSRCKINKLQIYSNSNNITITQNFISDISTYYVNLTNSVISNNITNYISVSKASYPLQITNNVFIGGTQTYVLSGVYNSTISNNIFIHPTRKMQENTGNTIINNIFSYDGTDANGNKYNIDMTDVFVDPDGTLGYSQDARYKLKAGSPAIGAGVTGVDCGVFGGATPYVLSGLPPIPRIYEAAIAGTAYSDKGLSCIIKIKAGK